MIEEEKAKMLIIMMVMRKRAREGLCGHRKFEYRKQVGKKKDGQSAYNCRSCKERLSFGQKADSPYCKVDRVKMVPVKRNKWGDMMNNLTGRKVKADRKLPVRVG